MTSVPATTPTTPKRAPKMTGNQQNLNHLLNFSLPPRQRQPPVTIPRRSRRTGNSHGVWNKERFVNAQYRFVMNPTGDYTVHFADPDIHFQWNDILQVIIPRSSAFASVAAGKHAALDEGHTSCPICLSPPTAPRMTKCGHIYCFPCILRYLSTSENKWARCPLCFDSVNASQLKSVKWFDGPLHFAEDAASFSSSSSNADIPFDNAPQEGSTMRMRLIQRPQITTLALPRSTTWPSDLLPPHQAPFHFLPDVFDFSKFMLVTPSQLISDLTRDLDELSIERRMFAGMHDDLGIFFIDAAEQKVKNQIGKASALDTPFLRGQIEKANRDHREIRERVVLHERRRKAEASPHASDVPQEFLALKSSSNIPSLPIPTSISTGHNSRTTPKQRRNINPPPPSTSTYFYYQAASGLPLYLHPVDIRILLSHFGEYASFPDSISIRVDAFSEGTVNDDLRKRCKYLAHLPEGADVIFVEADLEGVVGTEGLKNFEHALKMRKSRRKEKVRKDDRAKARAEERECEKRQYTAEVSWGSSEPRGAAIPLEPVTEIASEVEVLPSVLPVSGAWGQGSFASALRSTSTSSSDINANAQGHRPQRDAEDEWDIDIAWHELEQRSGTGKKKRNNKLVVLGGGGGRRGR
ncbi:hypothetical protein BDP27DRAFT_1381018 [Rhodocollybia butyracea]|uniref:RING-type domain-containing protein n=1 Tax=Rhodocollybia butyracea TaxID=206335 RepID=A0A9P5Q566_9AGAR|nr:hypothetical protein BDP27DRAFT_1381018 [Rhodocollybia butyracea]